MVQHINLMIQAAKHVGEVKEMSMTEACSFLPNQIKVTGITEDGEQFSLVLQVGDVKRDS